MLTRNDGVVEEQLVFTLGNMTCMCKSLSLVKLTVSKFQLSFSSVFVFFLFPRTCPRPQLPQLSSSSGCLTLVWTLTPAWTMCGS